MVTKKGELLALSYKKHTVKIKEDNRIDWYPVDNSIDFNDLKIGNVEFELNERLINAISNCETKFLSKDDRIKVFFAVREAINFIDTHNKHNRVDYKIAVNEDNLLTHSRMILSVLDRLEKER